jgi:hypothetical protein
VNENTKLDELGLQRPPLERQPYTPPALETHEGWSVSTGKTLDVNMFGLEDPTGGE